MKMDVYRKELVENAPEGFIIPDGDIIPVAIDWDEARVCVVVSQRRTHGDFCTHEVWMHENVHNDGTSNPTVAFCFGHYDFMSELEALEDAYERATKLLHNHTWMHVLKVWHN